MPEAAGLSYEHHGGGSSATGHPPLVLLHGAGGTQLYWPPNLRRLQGFSVYAPDLPGHGGSPGPGRSTIDDYRQAVERWMDALGLPPVIAVGHSMGGAVALSLSLDAPGRVAGLGLVATGARLRVHPMLLEATSLEAAGTEALMSAMYSPEALPQMRDPAARSLRAIDFAVLHGDFAACDGFDVMDRLDGVRQPALVVVGEQDQMTPVKYARYLAENLPRARLEIIPGAGHIVMLEQPAAVERALSAWLQTTFSQA